TGQVSTAPVALGTQGLYIQFPSAQAYGNDTWTINLPNTQGSNYITNSNAYQAALQTQNQSLITAQAAVDNASAALNQALANLALTQTAARPEDLAAANAQIKAAQAQLQTTQNNLAKSVISAPIDGVIASVDTKVGETVAGSSIAPGPDAVKMISDSKFQFTTYVSENDLGKIQIGDNAKINLQAYPGVDFTAAVINIEPAATITGGVSSYKT